jgi:hypothetical protein
LPNKEREAELALDAMSSCQITFIFLYKVAMISFLTQWVRMLKRTLSKAISIERPHWQKGFFDHLIRHSESYSEKWDYVRQNPVRAGLVEAIDDWPYQGEIVRLEM